MFNPSTEACVVALRANTQGKNVTVVNLSRVREKPIDHRHYHPHPRRHTSMRPYSASRPPAAIVVPAL